jgi:hypothetical protein
VIYSTGQYVPNVFGHIVLLSLKYIDLEPKRGLEKNVSNNNTSQTSKMKHIFIPKIDTCNAQT